MTVERGELWVIDTSSINAIRRQFQNPERARIYEALSNLVASDHLIFPREVFVELDRFKNPNKPDQPYQWARENQRYACRHGTLFSEWKALSAARPQLAKVLDPNKSDEEADPFVIALAWSVKTDYNVVVLTEDRYTTPAKLSLADACGLLRIVSMTVMPFLEEREIISSTP